MKKVTSLQPRQHQRSPRLLKKINIGIYQGKRIASRVWHSSNVLETARIAAFLVRHGRNNVWLLTGPLGGGKSTFVRAALKYLGYYGNVPSPTFALSRIYHLKRGPWKSVIHIDAYRIKGESEEAALDIASAVMDPRCLVLIEWPEKLKQRPWTGPLRLRFSHRKDGGRTIRASGIRP